MSMRYVGSLMSSLTKTQLTLCPHTRSYVTVTDECKLLASLCFLCFASRLCARLYQQPCQLSASGKSNYGPRSSLVLMPKGADAALDLAAWAAMTSDQVVTLMGERCSVCLCHWEAVGRFWILSSQGGGEEGRGEGGCGKITVKESNSSLSSQIFSCGSFR